MRRFAVVTTRGGQNNGATVGVMLEIQTPSLLPELVERLAATGCVTRPIDDRVCHVVHPSALDAAEEWQEVHFFLRAWQARNGVEVTLRPDTIRRSTKRAR